MDNHPSRESRNTPSRFILQKQEIAPALMSLRSRPITIGVDFTFFDLLYIIFLSVRLFQFIFPKREISTK